MKIETTIKRIEILAAHMETVPENEFNFGVWGSKGFKSGKSCGTVGCAIGHASTMKYFFDLGLRLYLDDNQVYPMVILKDKTRMRMEYGIGHLTKIFGGSEGLMRQLFIPGHGPDRLTARSTPQEWADQARKIVKELRKEHGIPEPKQQSQSSLQEQKSGQAGWRGLLETPRNLASDRPGVVPSRHIQHGQSACSAKKS